MQLMWFDIIYIIFSNISGPLFFILVANLIINTLLCEKQPNITIFNYNRTSFVVSSILLIMLIAINYYDRQAKD